MAQTDNARLNNFECDHQDGIKNVAKRTRQHESTWMNELKDVVAHCTVFGK